MTANATDRQAREMLAAWDRYEPHISTGQIVVQANKLAESLRAILTQRDEALANLASCELALQRRTDERNNFAAQLRGATLWPDGSAKSADGGMTLSMDADATTIDAAALAKIERLDALLADPEKLGQLICEASGKRWATGNHGITGAPCRSWEGYSPAELNSQWLSIARTLSTKIAEARDVG